MRIQDARRAMPPMPQAVGERVRAEVERQLAREERRARRRAMRVALAAALCVVGFATVACAAAVYRMTLERRGEYGVQMRVTAQGEDGLPETVEDVDITPGYVPEGMVYRAQDGRIASPQTPYLGGVTIAKSLLTGGEAAPGETSTHVVESEQRMFGALEGVYLRFDDLRQDGSFNQRIVLLSPQTHWAITLYIGDDVSREDAFRIAESLSIAPNGRTVRTENLNVWGETEVSLAQDDLPRAVDVDEIALHAVGEAFDIPAFCAGGDALTVRVRVDDVQIADDLSALGEDVPEDWQGAADEDGRLRANTLTFLGWGDGVDALDSVLGTRQTAQKLVYVTLTYANETDETMEELLYNGALLRIGERDGQLCVLAEAALYGVDADEVVGDGAADMGEMGYWQPVAAIGNGGNYIARLAPGQSQTVRMAWIVNEGDLAHMALDLTGGASYAFSEEARACGLVDLRVQ